MYGCAYGKGVVWYRVEVRPKYKRQPPVTTCRINNPSSYFNAANLCPFIYLIYLLRLSCIACFYVIWVRVIMNIQERYIHVMLRVRWCMLSCINGLSKYTCFANVIHLHVYDIVAVAYTYCRRSVNIVTPFPSVAIVSTRHTPNKQTITNMGVSYIW